MDFDIKAIAKSVIDKLDEDQVKEFLKKFADKETLEQLKDKLGDNAGGIIDAAKNLFSGKK